MSSKVTDILDSIETALGAIVGAAKVVRMGVIRESLIGNAVAGGFPVYLVRVVTRVPLDQRTGPNRPTNSSIVVQVVALDSGRTKGDTSWSAVRAEELENLVVAAVLADRLRGGAAYETIHARTIYAPEQFAHKQVDASVGVEFDVRFQHRAADLATTGP